MSFGGVDMSHTFPGGFFPQTKIDSSVFVLGENEDGTMVAQG